MWRSQSTAVLRSIGVLATRNNFQRCGAHTHHVLDIGGELKFSLYKVFLNVLFSNSCLFLALVADSSFPS